MLRVIVVSAAVVMSAMGWVARLQAQAPPTAEQPPAATAKPLAVGDASESDRGSRLASYLDGCKFIGTFTVDGETGLPKTEEYTISKCEKLPEEDMYRLTARIKYGDTNAEVPLDLPILWAGNAPVITLDSFGIPGLGTFSARVLLDRERYAGTWKHGDKGGHMFGRIEKIEIEK